MGFRKKPSNGAILVWQMDELMEKSVTIYERLKTRHLVVEEDKLRAEKPNAFIRTCKPVSNQRSNTERTLRQPMAPH
jgi:hypothetical protein